MEVGQGMLGDEVQIQRNSSVGASSSNSSTSELGQGRIGERRLERTDERLRQIAKLVSTYSGQLITQVVSR